MQGQPIFFWLKHLSTDSTVTPLTQHKTDKTFIRLDWVVTTSTLSIVPKKKKKAANAIRTSGTGVINVPMNVGRDTTYLPRAGKVVVEMISTRSAFNGRFSLFFKIPVVGTLCANNYITVEKVKQTTLKKTYVLGIS